MRGDGRAGLAQLVRELFGQRFDGGLGHVVAGVARRGGDPLF